MILNYTTGMKFRLKETAGITTQFLLQINHQEKKKMGRVEGEPTDQWFSTWGNYASKRHLARPGHISGCHYCGRCATSI